ncbi:hypothetical protein PENTCL1PPCAC_19109 [Pristionchus entomophagus]|uniref:F-box domain-containing protein n=1 Tax=Pristionchus entomophagus TaxID=358040 RepID=A0AAV5TRU2_9BILA|nr:hypothetical protein PENTCL1PPCAC_19109 [Pristionchus entomophagus]
MGKKNQPKTRRRKRDDSLSEEDFVSLTITDESIRELDSLSAFERFPAELVLKIIGYAPEAVFALKLTSRLLHSRVDEYIRIFSSPIVGEVVLKNISYDCNEYFTGSMTVSNIYSDLFELLLKRHHPLINFNQRIKRFNHLTSSSCRPDENEYKFEVSFEDEIRLEYLRSCIGKRIEIVALLNDHDNGPNAEAAVSKFFEGKQIDLLKVRANILSDDLTNRITQFISAHGIEQLSLDVKACSSSDMAKVLIDFSSIVRSLSIVQSRFHSSYGKNLFDNWNFEWAQVIIQMFSRKLDKLNLENQTHPWNDWDQYSGYFPFESIEELTHRFSILDKRVWLSVSFGYDNSENSTIIKGELNDTMFEVNENFIFCNKIRFEKYRIMKIKHLTRFNEPFCRIKGF